MTVVKGKQNELIELPCFIGDDVYIVCKKGVANAQISKIIISRNNEIVFMTERKSGKRISYWNEVDIGERVFFERTEAVSTFKEIANRV
ncbi:MAG: hypothetical protein FWD05_11250 [Oscillospiraceae bacterium]|nr:hypothetical protein [Oscillospiraceae bacterium]